jgi:hypothetical protein
VGGESVVTGRDGVEDHEGNGESLLFGVDVGEYVI